MNYIRLPLVPCVTGFHLEGKTDSTVMQLRHIKNDRYSFYLLAHYSELKYCSIRLRWRASGIRPNPAPMLSSM